MLHWYWYWQSMREFMAGPVHTLRRALLPLNCSSVSSSGGGEHRGGFGFARGRGAGLPAVEAGGGAGVGAGSGGVSGGVAGGATAGMNAIHDSLIKVLLRVDCIQPEVCFAV